MHLQAPVPARPLGCVAERLFAPGLCLPCRWASSLHQERIARCSSSPGCNVGAMTSDARRICVVTGARGYGLLRWLMAEIGADPRLRLQVVATGTHLERAFGHTADEIEADGFVIDRKVPLRLGGDSSRDVTRAAGKALAGIGDAFAELQPDLVVLLGNHYEALAAAQAALLARIPLAHIHGGETTFGASTNPCATPSPSWPSCTSSPRPPTASAYTGWRAAWPGLLLKAIGADNFRRLPLLDRPALAHGLKLGLTALPCPLLLVTYHPATLGRLTSGAGGDRAAGALAGLPYRPPCCSPAPTPTPATPPSARSSGLPGRHPRAHHFASLRPAPLPQRAARRRAVIGNSSSGIIEAPLCGTPTVNLGDRQRGRLRALGDRLRRGAHGNQAGHRAGARRPAIARLPSRRRRRATWPPRGRLAADQGCTGARKDWKV